MHRISNAGASFGWGAGHRQLVVVFAVAATVAVGWWLTRASGAGERMAVAAVLGGAAANLLDRLMHGSVTDWAQLRWYPATFNLADVCIRVGLVVAVALRWRAGTRSASGYALGVRVTST